MLKCNLVKFERNFSRRDTYEDIQHHDPQKGGAGAAGAGRDKHVRMRPDGIQLYSHRQRKAAGGVRYPQAVP